MSESLPPLPEESKLAAYDLQPGELHPMIYIACDFIVDFKNKKLHWRTLGAHLKEMAALNDRKAVVCLEAYRRIEADELIDQLFIFGFAWYVIEYMSANEKYEIVRKVAKRLRIVKKGK